MKIIKACKKTSSVIGKKVNSILNELTLIDLTKNGSKEETNLEKITDVKLFVGKHTFTHSRTADAKLRYFLF